MSKLDRFLVSDGILTIFPSISALCLDRHLSDHRPILLCEVKVDFGPIPFRFYHSWFKLVGFDDMVEQTWRALAYSDNNKMIRFKKKLQELKKVIRLWVNDKKIQSAGSKTLMSNLNVLKEMEDMDFVQKAKVRWAIEGLVSNTQSAFVAGRQILDGPFILNEVLDWCKRKKKKALFFKVDFAKAYDSVRWDFLLDVLEAFGFGSTCVLGFRVDEDVFKGIQLQGSLALSIYFMRDVTPFLWINIHKSQILGVGVSRSRVEDMASSLGCTIMENKFRYLGVMVGAGMTRHKAWDDGGIYFAFLLELLLPVRICIALSSARMKIVLLSSSPLNFAVGNHHSFATTLRPTSLRPLFRTCSSASEKKGGLGVSSYFALNRALLLKWVWRFVSQMILCWFVVIQAVHGDIDCVFIQFVRVSIWSSILKEVKLLKVIWNLISCRIALNDMMVAPLDTSFGDQLGRGRSSKQLSQF
ncbi:RNA-directed DNA polymerase, eukaryota [Tanacetum coccineum]|uniref:RNA-directed DNA polymerase, eukaryota n=1 Tax=Tanacetum coccineum TaxID=301880 RepID=A0ABQ5HU16_9ASTR